MSNSEPLSFMKKVQLFVLSIGPGLFIIGYNIGTGSVTSMASTGAEYGMTLTLPLLLSCIFTYILIVVFGKYTLVTGDTVIFSYKKHFGKSAGLFVLVALIFTEAVGSVGVMAIVTQVTQEWTRPLTESGNGIDPLYSTFGYGVILYALLWNGKQNFFEKVLAVFVGVMGLSFLVTMFMVIPEPAQVISGVFSGIPNETGAFLLVASMVGTTMGAVIYVVRSVLIKGKGWGMEQLPLEKRDAKISAVIMFVLSISVMAAAAGTMYQEGIKVDNAIDMVKLLEPFAGRFAITIFVGGILAAGLSSLFPHIMLAPMLLADYKGENPDFQSKTNRLISLGIILLSFTVPLFGGRPVFIMILSQVFIATVTPIVILLMFILMNKKQVVGEHTLSPIKNLLVGLILIFSIIMAVLGLIGIFSL
ncbi:MAG: divalent metal cation transporter [Balneolaceae bacterium]|nr:divalent metal cation transporter [Balneolaceae bacterium]MBO6547295.1 divalent metal cation transporter [Balneolaceae bacterium]MBO6647758.1 divalent metal cation transporter [Balneolaceae bacterium]